MSIIGVLPGEFLRGLDFRPANGQLYSIGTDGTIAHLYTINTTTAVATVVGPGFPLPPGTNPAGRFGFDFNPVVDRIRLTSGNNINVRIDPNTGTIVATDAPFSNPNVEIQALAYSNNYAGASNTTLYAIDDVNKNLVMIGGVNGSPSPNSGVVTVVGSLGGPFAVQTQFNGFDISACENVGYFVNNYLGSANIMRVDLTTGASTFASAAPAYNTVAGFTIQSSAPTCTFTVTVNDAPPTIHCQNDTIVNVPGQCSAVVNFLVSAFDACGIQSLITNPVSGSVFPAGTTTVTAIATDNSNQTSQCTFTVTVNGGGPALGQVNGPAFVCKGGTATYCVPAVPGVSQYQWTLPPGATGSSTGNCITVNFSTGFNGGQICVASVSTCGNGHVSCKALSVPIAKPAKPSPIVGNFQICAPSVGVYCISAVPNTESYQWTIAGNGGSAPATIVSGQGSLCVTVNFPAGYNGNQQLKVRAVNCKGQSDEQKADLKITPIPNMPGTISGPSSVCKSQLGFYSIGNVANATSYLWSVTGNVWIAGGQGTTSLALDFLSSNTTSATLSVMAQNGCGSSAPRTKVIAINPACKLSGNDLDQSTTEFDAIAYPNPTAGMTTIRFNQTQSSLVSIKLFDLTGRIMYNETVSSVEGLNEKDIDLTKFAKAVYILRIEDEHQSKTMQLIIQ